VKWRTRIKLAFLPLEPADLPELISSLAAVAQDSKALKHYRRLAKTPLFVLTTIGGWRLSYSILSYLSLVIAWAIPMYTADAIGFFMLLLLYSFGRKSYVHSVVRLHIIRKLRATAETITDIEVEPLLALHSFLKASIGKRSMATYKRTAELFSIGKEVIYYASLSSMALFVGSLSLAIGAGWAVAFRPWVAQLVLLGDVGIYGIVVGFIALFAANFVEMLVLGQEKPIFIDEDELSFISPASEGKSHS
jgi:hypothetical protein